MTVPVTVPEMKSGPHCYGPLFIIRRLFVTGVYLLPVPIGELSIA